MRARAARPQDVDLRRTAWRIGLQTAALLLACLVVMGGVVYASVLNSQQAQLQQTLRSAAGADGDRDNEPAGRGRREGPWVVVDGEDLPRGLPEGLPRRDLIDQVRAGGPDDERRLDLRTGPYEVLTLRRATKDGTKVVQVAQNLLGQHEERERILGALTLAGGAGLVLATLAGVVLARRAVRPMAEALEQQRRFVADAGHELRTPLTLLSTRAQLLARRVRDTTTSGPERAARTERDAAGLVADAGALVTILEDLLTAADARTPVPEDPVDLVDVASAGVAAAEGAAQQAGVVLALDTDGLADDDAVVHGAATALTRAVTALVDNAVDHARARVDVRVRREGRDVVLEVVDDGPGLDQETLPRVFDRFSSGRRDAAPDGRRHFGLGLALVSEIATRHGGRVSAANRPAPERGAVLRLAVPARPRTRDGGTRRHRASPDAPRPELPESVPTPGGRHD